LDVNALISQLLADPQVEGLFRIVLAAALGSFVGLEREMQGKPAGLRTYGLVGMGAATFTVVGLIAFGAGDPAARVAQGIVTGIGFIGAGTILHMTRRIVGLTTAAGIWVAAAVGMAVGAGMYLVGIGAALAMFLLLQFVRPEILVRLGLASQEDIEGRVRSRRQADSDE
jgi:putative Mg2+ transporter-C (MgtC) family protein